MKQMNQRLYTFSGDYESGDHISICPENSQEKVNFLLSRMTSIVPMNIPLQLTLFEEREFAATHYLPSGTTLMELLIHFVDLSSVPSQDVLKLFSTFAKDSTEKKILKKLSENEDAYQTWRKDAMKGICGTLEDFPSVTVDSAQLLSQLPLMRRRTFSVASSGTENKVTLVVGIVGYRTPNGEPKEGLLTGHFLMMVIMIGAGTGIAPFKGFWMKRLDQKQEGHEIGKFILYFGCRKRNMELLKAETDQLRQMGIERQDVFSREKGEPRQYVQDLVREDGAKIYKTWMKEDGVIFLCGKVAMVEEVGQVLRNILEVYGKMDKEEAAQVTKNKKSQGSIWTSLVKNQAKQA